MLTQGYLDAVKRELDRLEGFRQFWARCIARIEDERANGAVLDEDTLRRLAMYQHMNAQFEHTTKTRLDFMSRIDGEYYPPVKDLVISHDGRLDPVLMEGDRQFTAV